MLFLNSVTVLVSAGLLFVVEPLVAKSLLPMAGGTAAVWTTAAAFFQTALLGGYLYAHALRRWLRPQAQATVHVVALVVVYLAFPLRPPSLSAAGMGLETLSLFGELCAVVGAPFLVLAATAPLVQHWFSISRHVSARDPYFLYAASNVGSLLALLVYPFAIEPMMGLTAQRSVWTALFAAQIALLASCAIAVWRAQRCVRNLDTDPGSARTQAAPTWKDRLRWTALSAVPSSLLLSVTNYISTDVAALPLLWVAPLVIYLVTFVLAFSQRQPLSRERALWAQPFLLLPVIVSFAGAFGSGSLIVLAFHVSAFFVTALVCHQALAAARPDPSALTEYYVWISAGGALGGLFNVLVAPVAFRSFIEYPLGMGVAVLLVYRSKERRIAASDVAVALSVAAAVLVGAVAIRALPLSNLANRAGMASLAGVVGLCVFRLRERPLRFALGVGAFACAAYSAQSVTSAVLTARSFFGVHTVLDAGNGLRLMVHGNTVHGAQSLKPDDRREPLTYYNRAGPIGQFFEAWRGRLERGRVAVVGLGTGSLAAYSEPGEHWTFFEIDPEVVKTARDSGLFSFLAEANGRVDVTLGDARHTLQAEPDSSVGVLVLDAFSSDSIPAHLLTREAFGMYFEKLRPSGVIAVHVSNRYLDVASVVAATARSCGAVALLQGSRPTAADGKRGKSPSQWMLLARSADSLSPFIGDRRWSAHAGGGRVWTDDWTSVWTIVRFPGGLDLDRDGVPAGG